MLHDYFNTEEADNDSNENENNSNESNIDEVSIIETDSSSIATTDSSSVQTSTNSSIESPNARHCVGVLNSVSGAKRKFAPKVCRCIKCKPDSSCEFGVFKDLLAMHSKKCAKKDAYKAID